MRGQSRSHFTDEQWAAAREQATRFLQERAGAPDPLNMTYYEEVCQNITATEFDPDSNALAELLGEISTAEYRAGRGMLSAIVIHKPGEQSDERPGRGFGECARSLRLPTRDLEALWITQMNVVHNYWRRALAGQGAM